MRAGEECVAREKWSVYTARDKRESPAQVPVKTPARGVRCARTARLVRAETPVLHRRRIAPPIC